MKTVCGEQCRISAPAGLCDGSCAPHTMRISVSSPHDVWFDGVGDIAVTSVHATILMADRDLRRDLAQATSPAYRTSGARSPVFLLRACGMAQWEKLRHRNIDSDRGHTCRGCEAPTTGKIEGRVRRPHVHCAGWIAWPCAARAQQHAQLRRIGPGFTREVDPHDRLRLMESIECSAHRSDQFFPTEWFLHETCCFGDGNRGCGVTRDDNHLHTLAVQLLDQIVRHLLFEVDVHERNPGPLLGNEPPRF